MISIVRLLIEFDARDTAQNFANTNLNVPKKIVSPEELMRAKRLQDLKGLRDDTTIRPGVNVQKELAQSKVREAAANDEANVARNTIKVYNPDPEGAKIIVQKKAAAVTKGVVNKVNRNQPGSVVNKVTTEQPVTNVANKTTSAMEDLGSATRKIGQGIKTGTQEGISSVGRGIRKVGEEIESSPGTAGAIAAGAGIAAYAGKKLFGKPKNR